MTPGGNFLVQSAVAAELERKFVERMAAAGFFPDGAGLLHDSYTIPADRVDEFMSLRKQWEDETMRSPNGRSAGINRLTCARQWRYVVNCQPQAEYEGE